MPDPSNPTARAAWAGRSAFWDDLNRRMADDPEFRAAYIAEALRVQAYDEAVNAGHEPEKGTPVTDRLGRLHRLLLLLFVPLLAVFGALVLSVTAAGLFPHPVRWLAFTVFALGFGCYAGWSSSLWRLDREPVEEEDDAF